MNLVLNDFDPLVSKYPGEKSVSKFHSCFYPVFIILAGNEDMYKCLDE